MTQKTITIADVAKKAGVSTMTVSRAINNKGEITEATRQKVLRIAADLGYRPNRIARGLATKQTMQLGLVVPDITNPFFSQIALGAQNTAWQRGYNLLLLNTMEDKEREDAILDMLAESQVDGVILCSSRLTKTRLEERLTSQPGTVLINRQVEAKIAGLICINDVAGTELAVNHLIAGGRKRIGLLAGPTQSFSSYNRKQGYLNALNQAQILIDPHLQISCDPTPSGGQTACTTLLQQHPHIDALFCYNDLVAVGALQACVAMGKTVPDDVALVGVDNIPLANLISPQLTTLHTSAYKIGVTAVELLFKHLEAPSKNQPVFFDQELIVRQSAP